MAGYAAMARVQGGRVHALAWTVATPADTREPDVPEPRRVAAAQDPGRPTIRERWRWLREELGMLTFFLLDPESWR